MPYSDEPRRPSASGRPTGARPAQSRPTQRPTNAHPAGKRPVQNGRRPVKKHKKKTNPAPFLFLLMMVVVIAAACIYIFVISPAQDRVPTVQPTAAVEDPNTAPTPDTGHTEALAAMLNSEGTDVTGRTADQLVEVTDLHINESLPDTWLNILLLGSDERSTIESSRTDSMIICSINRTTGQVKLTSILRDLAVDYTDLGEENGTYRINAANFFGGEQYAVKTVNELFGMNIQYYVRVNFYGFQEIAQILGGVEVDVTQEEMEEINKRIVEVYKFAQQDGIDDSNLPTDWLESYGPDTHLDGRQTLAYARLRKVGTGGDYARSERQRAVLVALMNKLHGAGAGELLTLGLSAISYVNTNLTLDEIINMAQIVVNSNFNDAESLRLPINDSYKQERRNNMDMFYDCDWTANASALYSFIYG